MGRTGAQKVLYGPGCCLHRGFHSTRAAVGKPNLSEPSPEEEHVVVQELARVHPSPPRCVALIPLQQGCKSRTASKHSHHPHLLASPLAHALQNKADELLSLLHQHSLTAAPRLTVPALHPALSFRSSPVAPSLRRIFRARRAPSAPCRPPQMPRPSRLGYRDPPGDWPRRCRATWGCRLWPSPCAQASFSGILVH
jgi:hypothetical protein